MNRANDLFLLLLNLAQMRCANKVTDLFLGGLGEMFAPWTFQWVQGAPDGTQSAFPITTRNSAYGHIVPAGGDPLSEEDRSLLYNAAQMLAVVLERLEFEEKLERERSAVSVVADKRFEELQATIGQLQRSRSAYVNLVEDLTRENAERQRAEDALRESERRLRSVFETMTLIGVMLDTEGRVTFCNDHLLDVAGWTLEETLGCNWFERFLPPDVRDEVRRVFIALMRTGQTPTHHENEIVTRSGERRAVSWNNTPLIGLDGTIVGVASIGEDITERKRAEEERERLQLRLVQAQKMESVGRLAGGVAHDFNNMLGAILGNTSLVLMDLPLDSPLRDSLTEIEKCARRSADLTRQLLAFARKQTVTPRVLDLNATVEGMLKLLRRLIGESIDLTWTPAPDLWPVRIDPSQIDQILANLCLNARDAIQGSGRVAIETANAVIDEHHAAGHPGFVPGDYVRLSVSDTGCGMDPETLAQIFEPFFTTKGPGQGTGLGLATVYGIVRQNHGSIQVASEPTHGATFHIYLPHHIAAVAPVSPTDDVPTVHGHGTILLVEDEPSLLRIGQRVLRNLGYTVLAASTPGEAIRQAEAHEGPIHLLITDVVMPGMNGRDLARRLVEIRPGLKRLFMSGYTADVIAHQGVLDEGVHFIQKPFTVPLLAQRVRQVLDAE